MVDNFTTADYQSVADLDADKFRVNTNNMGSAIDSAMDSFYLSAGNTALLNVNK